MEEAFELWKLYLESWAEMAFGQSEVEIYDTEVMGLGTSKIDHSQYILFDLVDVHSLLSLGLKVNKDTDFSHISKHAPGFLEIVSKKTLQALQRLSYPSLLVFDHRSVDKPSEKTVWHAVFFGIAALANSSQDTRAKFAVHDGMGDLNLWKVCYNWDMVKQFCSIGENSIFYY